MSKAETLRQKLEAARQIRQSSVNKFRKLIEEFENKKREIDAYYELNDLGKSAMKNKLTKQFEEKTAELARSIKSQYLNALAQVKREAEDILLSDPEPANERQAKLFAMKAKQLENAILFAPNVKQAMTYAKELAALANEHPTFARGIQEKFYPLASHIASMANGEEKLTVLREFSRMNNELTEYGMTQDQRQAREILAVAEGWSQGEALPYAVREAVKDRISKQAANLLDQPVEAKQPEGDEGGEGHGLHASERDNATAQSGGDPHDEPNSRGSQSTEGADTTGDRGTE